MTMLGKGAKVTFDEARMTGRVALGAAGGGRGREDGEGDGGGKFVRVHDVVEGWSVEDYREATALRYLWETGKERGMRTLPRALREMWEGWREEDERGKREEEERRVERRGEIIEVLRLADEMLTRWEGTPGGSCQAPSDDVGEDFDTGAGAVGCGEGVGGGLGGEGAPSFARGGRRRRFYGGSPSPPLHASVRSSLPAFRLRSSLLSAVSSSRVTVVKGATGSGKSTQVPQYIVENFRSGGVLVTQPRR